MLILTRRVQEALLIGDDIVITITKVRGQAVRIAVDAPRGVNIGRIDRPPSPPKSRKPGPVPKTPAPSPRLAG